jgi:hypothetical protein
VLWAQGRTELLAGPALAMVGSRSATRGGIETARSFAQALGEQGVTVVSGLAQGIDAAAHRGGALDTAGGTVAVLGTGTDRVYPRQQAPLAAAIAQRGLLLSELPPGTEPRRGAFPQAQPPDRGPLAGRAGGGGGGAERLADHGQARRRPRPRRVRDAGFHPTRRPQRAATS